MAPAICHLPNGQNLTVTPVFGGISFKANEHVTHRAALPPGWNVVLNQEDADDEEVDRSVRSEIDTPTHLKKPHVHRYKRPSLHNDHLFISAISSPNNAEYKPPTSPTRQLAMMLWGTLWWYFHQPEPDKRLYTHASQNTINEGKPKGEWRINIRREGIFKGKNVLAKLERMGLIISDDSSVGTGIDDKIGIGFSNTFVTRRAFWQMDARIYLFTLSPALNSPFPAGSPFSSRPGSPNRQGQSRQTSPNAESFDLGHSAGMSSPHPPGPFHSTSHLPTYYPPHPAQYVFTGGIRHPLRPKPFRQGETFYVRYIPSLGQYLSFRVASLSATAPVSQGPWTTSMAQMGIQTPRGSLSDTLIPTLNNFNIGPNDVELLHEWMNKERVAHSWGEQGPIEHQEEFLRHNLQSRHSFPVIGCFDGKPFGYFEIYWVKEDILGKYMGGEVGDYDRGLHCLVGEDQFRGPGRVRVWLSALIHFCLLSDMRTEAVLMEPRVDNDKLKNYCQEVGFYKQREISFPHKQSNLMKIRRTTFESPVI